MSDADSVVDLAAEESAAAVEMDADEQDEGAAGARRALGTRVVWRTPCFALRDDARRPDAEAFGGPVHAGRHRARRERDWLSEAGPGYHRFPSLGSTRQGRGRLGKKTMSPDAEAEMRSNVQNTAGFGRWAW